MGEGSKGTRQRASAPIYVRSLRAPVGHILPGRSDARVTLQSRKQASFKHRGLTSNRTRSITKSRILLAGRSAREGN